MTRDEHTTNRPTPGGSAFQETAMTDHLTRVAEAVRDACAAEAFMETTLAVEYVSAACPGEIISNMILNNIDLQAVIASVPRPDPVAAHQVSAASVSVDFPHDEIDRTAAARYCVIELPPSEQSLVPWSVHAVLAGNGECRLYRGRRAECQNVARKLAGAFSDGAFFYAQRAKRPVPHGWKLVPVEPSIAACIIGSNAAGGAIDGRQCAVVYRAMHAAAPEAPQPVLDRPASIGGTTFGVGIPVRTLVAAAQRRYEAEQTPASQAERQALIDALRRPVVDAELTTLREQNAALVVAMQNIVDEFVPGDEQKLYGTPTDVLDRIRSMARAALASVKGGAA